MQREMKIINLEFSIYYYSIIFHIYKENSSNLLGFVFLLNKQRRKLDVILYAK